MADTLSAASAAKGLFCRGRKRSFAALAALRMTSTCVLVVGIFHGCGVSRRLMATPGRGGSSAANGRKCPSPQPSPGVPGEGVCIGDTRRKRQGVVLVCPRALVRVACAHGVPWPIATIWNRLVGWRRICASTNSGLVDHHLAHCHQCRRLPDRVVFPVRR